MRHKAKVGALGLVLAMLGGGAWSQTASTAYFASAAPGVGGLQGDFGEGFWDRPFDPEDMRSARFSIALAMLIPNLRAFRVDADPILLQREVRLYSAPTRKIALDNLARVAGVTISKSGQSLNIMVPEPVRIAPVPVTPPAVAAAAPTAESKDPVASSTVSTIDISSKAATDPAPPPPPPPPPVYRATLADENIRLALVRWAKLAGWTFAPEHWNSPVDISLSAEADFGADFKTATRNLLAATELSSSPLQPCFYSNQVLRVIPMVERCDRTRTN